MSRDHQRKEKPSLLERLFGGLIAAVVGFILGVLMVFPAGLDFGLGPWRLVVLPLAGCMIVSILGFLYPRWSCWLFSEWQMQ